jgi:UDP-2,4-diacetamido-2,4,6-trideoxy-beta-L-altropyranose hydrolase
MIVALRADASLRIGSGHVMRCLNLADALLERGHSCLFLSRDLEGPCHDVVRSRGHELEVLEASGEPYVPDESAPAHAAWLECGWQEDARATREALDRSGASVLVVDHYALDRRWEEAVAVPGLRLAAIDDLADRPHAVSLLLDQNLGRTETDYDGLVPEDCLRLIGPDHALVGPQFARLREESLFRRKEARMEHIMVSMGGVDTDDATSAVLECLGETRPTMLREVSVIMGRHAPHLERVRAMAADISLPVEVAVDVTDMAERMTRADLAVGGAGVTAWERCALGLPSIAVVLAENQRGGAKALGEAGAALVAGDKSQVAAALKSLGEPGALGEMSRRAAAVVDALGLERTASAVEEFGGGAPAQEHSDHGGEARG